MNTLSDKDWESILSHLAEILGDDAKRLAKLPTARLVAAIPYLAGSEDPDRFAVSNLLTFHGAAKARRLFDHRTSDDSDVFRRLATFHVGSKADPKVVDYGLSLLALVSLADHEKDAEQDRKAGKYNPVNAKVWDVSTTKKELQDELDRSPALKASFAPLADPALVGAVWQ